jgi:hypothetical protein
LSYGREKAVRFGTSASLVGVVTEPAPGSDAAGKPVFLMLNAGILHRVGSCRLHVRVARALSAAGFTTLRFDYSGIGDSDSRRDSLPFEESGVIETREAMDYLAKTKGAQRFVLMGLCSGADMAHETAVADDRVVGLMMFDAWAYRTFAYYVRHYGPRLFDWRVWQNAIRIRFGRLMGSVKVRTQPPTSEGVEYEVAKYVRVFPPQEKVARDLKTFVQRGIAMYCVWTGGLVEYNHRGQYAEAFREVGFGNLLREEHLADADHIMTGLHHQEYVLENVVAWANSLARSPAETPVMTHAS